MNSVERPSEKAFTITEVLAALVLATMLLVVLMGLTARMSQSHQDLTAQRPDNSWQTQLAETLQSDFESCRFVSRDANQLVFEGYSIPKSVDFGLSDEIPAGHVSTKITYETVNSATSSWLVRTEELVNFRQPDFRHTTLMASGITHFRSLDPLETNVAPPVLRIQVVGPAFSTDGKAQINLVRHGGIQN